MKDAASFRTVEVGTITFGDDAQFGEVQMGILALERIKRPGDFFRLNSLNPYGQGALALRELQAVPKIKVTVGLADRQHMRMNGEAVIVHSEQAEGESGPLTTV